MKARRIRKVYLESIFKELCASDEETIFTPFSFLWKSMAPSKVKLFTWLLVKRKVNTNEAIQMRKPYNSIPLAWCVLRRRNNETIDHLFLYCDFAAKIWSHMLQEFRLSWAWPNQC